MKAGRVVKAGVLTVGFVAALGFATALASPERAAVDPSVAREVVVGEPRGPAPMMAVSRGRTRSTSLEFPSNPKVKWRARVEGPVRHEPVVDAHGHVIVAHGRGRFSELDRNGKLAWSHRLGDAMTSTGPVLMSDGTRAVLEHDNTLLRVAPDGQILGRSKTSLTGSALPPLPTHDGGLALAAGQRALRVNPLGETTAEGELERPIRSILGRAGLVYLVGADGGVYRFFASGRLQKLGGFGHELVGAAALASNTLVGIVEGGRLASFNLTTRVSRTLFRAPRGIEFAPWLAVDSDAKRTLAVTTDHMLLGFDLRGNEQFRAALSGGPGVTTRPQTLDVQRTPPALVDAKGTVAIMTPGWYTLLIAADGARTEIKDGNCLSPVGITPYASKQVVTTCGAGEIWLLSES